MPSQNLPKVRKFLCRSQRKRLIKLNRKVISESAKISLNSAQLAVKRLDGRKEDPTESGATEVLSRDKRLALPELGSPSNRIYSNKNVVSVQKATECELGSDSSDSSSISSSSDTSEILSSTSSDEESNCIALPRQKQRSSIKSSLNLAVVLASQRNPCVSPKPSVIPR